jgi:hypothetical protein
MLVSWTEQAMVPHTLPSKVAQVFASPADRMFVQEAKFDPSSHEAGVHYVYVPDSTREAVTAKVDQDFAADTAPQVTDLGGGHMLVQFSSKLSAQKFLLARRAENGDDPATAQWWSGDISFGQWQQQHRAKQRAKQRAAAEDGVHGPEAAEAPAEDTDPAGAKQLREMGFSGPAVASALTTHAGNVEAAAAALLEDAAKADNGRRKEEMASREDDREAPAAPSSRTKKDNDDWVRASRGVRDAPKKPKVRAAKK